MKKNLISRIALFLLVIIYNFLFWKEKLGVNALIFSVLIIAVALFLNKKSISDKRVVLSVSGTILSGVFVIIYNSFISKFMHIATFGVAIGFMHSTGIRTVYNSFMTYLQNQFMIPQIMIESLGKMINGNNKSRKFFRYFKISIFPVFVFVVFLLIYKAANPVFGGYLNNFFDALYNLFLKLSILKILFIVLGLFLISAAIFKGDLSQLLKSESKQTYELIRKRKPNKFLNWKMNGLKYENYAAIIVIGLVNMLLLCVNIIDINWIWIDFTVPEGFSLKQFVHKGTYLLILSILLSICVLLYFFRKNLNFYSKNKLLRILSFIWIFQNGILCISVFLRNYYYIDFHGLAYLRIGVVIFLILSMFGLISLYFKILKVRSGFYLLHNNSWALYFVLISMCFFNWDMIIVKYNLNHKNANEIDIDNYLRLSDKVLPVLYDNLNLVEKQMEAHKNNKVKWAKNLDFNDFKERLDERRGKFQRRQERYSFGSWNFPDANSKKYFESKGYYANQIISAKSANKIKTVKYNAISP